MKQPENLSIYSDGHIDIDLCAASPRWILTVVVRIVQFWMSVKRHLRHHLHTHPPHIYPRHEVGQLSTRHPASTISVDIGMSTCIIEHLIVREVDVVSTVVSIRSSPRWRTLRSSMAFVSRGMMPSLLIRVMSIFFSAIPVIILSALASLSDSICPKYHSKYECDSEHFSERFHDIFPLVLLPIFPRSCQFYLYI